jgi:predicted nucleic acid-binding protein
LIVPDASAIVELLLQGPGAAAVEARLFAAEETWHAPYLLDLEVAQVLRRYAAAGELDAERGRQAVEDLGDLPLTRYPHEPFLLRIWELRHNVTAYDAAYLALAEALPAPLLTCDRRLATAPGHRARVEVV